LSKQEKRQHIPESYKKVLLQVAKEGPQTKYDIEKKTKVNHASVHEAIKYFVKVGDVEGKKVGVTRTGQAKIIYELTFSGIWQIVKIIDPKDYDEVFPKLKSFLPLIFGKWSYFRSCGLLEELVKVLNWLSKEVDYWFIGRLWAQNRREWIPEEARFNVERWVMEQFGTYAVMFQTPKSKILWLKAFRGDNELRQWAIKEIKMLLYEGRQFMYSHEKSLEALKKETEPDWNEVGKALRFHAPEESPE
jgi:predicted transcriptional regulator